MRRFNTLREVFETLFIKSRSHAAARRRSSRMWHPSAIQELEVRSLLTAVVADSIIPANVDQPNGLVAGDHLGNSVAVQGDYTVVGANGAANVYHRENAGWVFQQRLAAVDGAEGFGNAVAIDGDTIVVGALKDSNSAFFRGSAFVFVRSGATWTQQQKLVASDGGNIDLFGAAVAISGNTIAVTASDDDGGVIGNSDTAGVHDQGSAYVFTRSDGVWTQRAHCHRHTDDHAGQRRTGCSQ